MLELQEALTATTRFNGASADQRRKEFSSSISSSSKTRFNGASADQRRKGVDEIRVDYEADGFNGALR